MSILASVMEVFFIDALAWQVGLEYSMHMSITNHMLAGSLIGLATHNPAFAVIASFASHFVMDAMPHYGYPGSKDYAGAVKAALKHKTAHYFSYISAITLVALGAYLLINAHYFAFCMGLVVMFPDIYMTGYYLFIERKGKELHDPFTKLNIKFHGKIQFERPWGIATELVFFVGATFILFSIS